MNPISPSISPSTGAPRRTRSTGAPRRTGRCAWTLRRAGLALALTLAAATPAMAELRLDITRGQVEPMPIAIVPFVADSGGAGADGEAGLGRDVAAVVTADLAGSGLFAPVDPPAFLQAAGTLATGPRLANGNTASRSNG